MKHWLLNLEDCVMFVHKGKDEISSLCYVYDSALVQKHGMQLNQNY